MSYARELTQAEMLAHPWWGVPCPSCRAEAGVSCGPDGKIHGQRTTARRGDYVDPRSPTRTMSATKLEPAVRQLVLFGLGNISDLVG